MGQFCIIIGIKMYLITGVVLILVVSKWVVPVPVPDRNSDATFDIVSENNGAGNYSYR